MRKGVCTILHSRADIEVCGEAADGREAIDKALELKPDLLILDLTMPVMGGFEAAVELLKLRERLDHRGTIVPDIPIIFYSMHEGSQLIRHAQEIGVRGFVSKRNITDTLLDAVDAVVLRRQTFFPDSSDTNEKLSLGERAH